MSARRRVLPLAVLLASALAGACLPGAATAQPGAPEIVPAAHDEPVTPSGPGKTFLDLGTASGAETYLVQLHGQSVPTRTLNDDGSTVTKAPSASSYRRELRTKQRGVIAEVSAIVGAAAEVSQTYTEAINGFAVELTRGQARKVSELAGVASVTVDHVATLSSVELDTIGAPALWDGTGLPEGTRGEGMLIGIIDSGINPANPAFATTVPTADGGDGYVHTNPRGAGNYLGMCDPADPDYQADWGCTEKLIGAYRFGAETARYDSQGHGSHVASTAAGNQQQVPGPPPTVIAGVAPHANLISYDVCVNGAGCPDSSVIAAIDQAIRDGVDVLNHSIGSTNLANVTDLWHDPKSKAILSARHAGIRFVTSAGNNATATGAPADGGSTLVASGDIPWATSVAATSRAPYLANAVIDTTSGGAGLPDIRGGGSYPAPPAPITATIIDARAYGTGSFQGQCRSQDLTTADLTDAVVICDRGTTARTDKSTAVAARGAVGMILANTSAGQSINYDPHSIATVHLSKADADALRGWLAERSPAPATTTLTGPRTPEDAAPVDVLADFSSRGPNRAADTLAPQVAAPGVEVLAAYGTDNAVAYGTLSGTSMASPHVAGGTALLADLHPDWTPAEVQSALMSSADAGVRDIDRGPATWHEQGAGRIDLPAAAKAGLVLDITTADYLAADPDQDGDPRQLNMPALMDSTCVADCSWSRTLEATATGAGTWTVSTSAAPGLTLATSNSTFTLASGDTATLDVTADVSGATSGKWLEGSVVLTPPVGSDSGTLHLPVSVKVGTHRAPLSSTVTARRSASSVILPGVRATETTPLSVTSLADVQTEHRSVLPDPTPANVFDDLGQVDWYPVTVPDGTTALRVGVGHTGDADLDLYLGTGAMPSNATLKCASGRYGSAERCLIRNPTPGTWWVLVQSYAGSPAGDAYDRNLLLTGAADGRLTVTPATSGQARVRATWDLADLTSGSSTAVLFIADQATLIRLRRDPSGDIAADTASTAAGPGEPVTYRVRIAPDLPGTEPVYTIHDAPGPGMSVVASSITGGGSLAGGTVTWHGTRAQLAAAARIAAGDPVVLTYQATVDAGQPAGAVITRTLRHTTDDPGTREETISGTVSVNATPPAAQQSSAVTLSTARRPRVRGKRVPLTIRVSSAGAAASGSVRVRLTGAGRRVDATLMLVNGEARLRLPRYLRTGKVRIVVSYPGSGTTLGSEASATLKVRR
ncbi:S8 family serine peptidase [Nocardioides daeguensis]|uniref:Serine protease n=1 Tax=Nocardioides daeguensis TaxID=908359 RepID=A0ABP6WIX0_9ACTN|nr:S8 family serine peptidase [Nocardioides daeguensis]MBV6729119.1 S8 family serine peptidase [Nocardioides daeguensis]MCR1774877.1 S8 family serine peptidase [Nocardioides daeguensis]